MALPGAGRDSDTLQQLRASLPCEVRVTSVTHPLFGQLLRARGFKRRSGVVLLVVTLPDGSPGTMRADASDILSAGRPEEGSAVLSADGLRHLHQLVSALAPARQRRGRPKTRK
jgi:hypothetical protein